MCYALRIHFQEFLSMCVKYNVDVDSRSLSVICSAVMDEFDLVVNGA